MWHYTSMYVKDGAVTETLMYVSDDILSSTHRIQSCDINVNQLTSIAQGSPQGGADEYSLKRSASNNKMHKELACYPSIMQT